MNKKTWFLIVLVGLSGQIAWTIENMYFNVFLYNTISTDPSYIATMVASSAVVATLTTIIMGAFSDKIGKRKPFIAIGYIIWALTVLLFAFVSPQNFHSVKKAAIAVIVLDCVMTFFGSTANDAVFNAYITESVDNKNRTKVESVVQILPMASMLLVFGLMDGLTQKGNWPLFFTITAIIMAIAGLLSFILIDDKKREKEEKGNNSFVYLLSYGFRKETIKNNKELYVSLIAFAFTSFAMQIFFPYLIIYIQNFLGFSSYVVLLAIVLVVASVVCVFGGKIVKRGQEVNSSFLCVVIMALGLLMMTYARSFVFTTIAGIVMMSGYLLSTSLLSALIRGYTPKGNEGGIQGVRMICQVMLPMVIGPFVGSIAIKGSNLTYEELGVVKTVPTPLIFTISSVVALLSIIPLVHLKKLESKNARIR